MLDSVKYGFNCTYEATNLKFGKNSPVFIDLNEEDICQQYTSTILSMADIGRKHNVSGLKIKSILDNNNINTINKKNSKYKIDYKQVYNEYLNDNISIPILAKKYGVDKSTIRNQFIIKKFKIKENKYKKNINIIYKRYLNGEKILNIANEYKVDATSIYNYFIKCELKTNFDRLKKIKQDINKIYLRYLNGESIISVIAPEYKILPYIIYRLFKKHNLKLR